MTAVIEDLDLDRWVTYSNGPEESCRYRKHNQPCALEPVARAEWEQDCCDVPAPELLCTGHRDRVKSESAIAAGWFRCPGCEAPVLLIRIGPLR